MSTGWHSSASAMPRRQLRRHSRSSSLQPLPLWPVREHHRCHASLLPQTLDSSNPLNCSGWHLCRTKCPRRAFDSKTKIETKSETESSKNAQTRPQTSLSPVQLPKNVSPAVFHSFAPTISNTISNVIQTTLVIANAFSGTSHAGARLQWPSTHQSGPKLGTVRRWLVSKI